MHQVLKILLIMLLIWYGASSMAETGHIKTFAVNQIAFYKANQNDLLRTSVPVYTGANQQWFPVLRVHLDNLRTDELLSVMGSVEITNDTGHNVNCVTKIVVNSNYDDEPGQNGAFIISAGGGGNASFNRHHELLLRPANWIPDQYYGARNITLMLRAVSSVAVSGDIVNLTGAPCELTVKRFQSIH